MPDRRVAIIYSSTLQRFTSGILAAGFAAHGWEIVPYYEASCVIAQIHGSPAAEREDLSIIDLLQSMFEANRHSIAILIHRPDEVQDRLPELQQLLKNAPPKVAISFLGPHHKDDPFFGANRRIVIPHGFFEPAATPTQAGPIIIGAHTSWGEIRSAEAATLLLRETFKTPCSSPIVGYLGGSSVDLANSRSMIESLMQGIAPVCTPAEVRVPLEAYNGPPLLLFNPSGRWPDEVQLTFNIQLYHYGDAIRTGESSGSAHTGGNIPVIWEMNGAEILEELHVIKVPYAERSSWRTSDFSAAAERIHSVIETGKLAGFLHHNYKRAQAMSPAWVAARYIEIFEGYKEKSWIFH